MKLLTGREVADSLYQEISDRLAQNPDLKPTLAVILVGSDPASRTYVASKSKKCEMLGFGHRDYILDERTTQSELLDLVESLNNDDEVDGILVQSPLPGHLDEPAVVRAIDPAKDVDGFHPFNQGALLTGGDAFVPCTPLGIMKMLDYYDIPVKGKRAVVIGRSTIVGKPVAALLLNRDATVTVCHSKTENIEKITKEADILVVAVGKAGMVTPSFVKEGAVVIDVGINRVPDSTRKRGYRVTGDVDFESVSPLCSAITPVPRGVGVMTIASLMYNTLLAAEKRRDG